MPKTSQTPLSAATWLPYQLYKWLVVVPLLLVTTAGFGTIIIVMCFLGQANAASRVIGGLWARINSAVMFMRVNVDGRDRLQPGQSYVLVANHLSLVDIYLLSGFADLDLKWVMKQELRRVPILGLACELMGHIYVDRTNSSVALASIEEARSRIRDGMCVVFFPEGTRSRTSELRPFKKGAFRMAVDLGIPVVPVSIHGTDRVLPSDSLDWRPGHVSLCFHPPIELEEDANLRQVANQSRDLIARALES